MCSCATRWSSSRPKRYGYAVDQVRLRLYVGRFAGGHQDDVVKRLDVGARVETLEQIVDSLLETARPRTYTDDPVVVMTVKALAAAGRLPDVAGTVPV